MDPQKARQRLSLAVPVSRIQDCTACEAAPLVGSLTGNAGPSGLLLGRALKCMAVSRRCMAPQQAVRPEPVCLLLDQDLCQRQIWTI